MSVDYLGAESAHGHVAILPEVAVSAETEACFMQCHLHVPRPKYHHLQWQRCLNATKKPLEQAVAPSLRYQHHSHSSLVLVKAARLLDSHAVLPLWTPWSCLLQHVGPFEEEWLTLITKVLKSRTGGGVSRL